MSELDCRLFLPHYLDTRTPISSIHRDVAKRLDDSFYIGALAFTHDDKLKDVIDDLFVVPEESSLISKPAKYVRAYFRDWDVVHTGPSRRHYLARISSIRNASIVHTLHAAPENAKIVNRQRRLAMQADVITAVSPFVKDWASETLGISSEILVIPNGIDLENFSTSETVRNDLAVFAGRLVEQKNPGIILRIAKDLPSMNFKVCGDGELMQELQKDSPTNVEFLGRVRHEKLVNLFSRALVTLCPYEREGFGLVCIESRASGTPVIGYASGNLPHLISEQNGILCDSLDETEWVDAIQFVRNNTGSFDPQDGINRFGWDSVAEEYESLYRAVSPGE